MAARNGLCQFPQRKSPESNLEAYSCNNRASWPPPRKREYPPFCPGAHPAVDNGLGFQESSYACPRRCPGGTCSYRWSTRTSLYATCPCATSSFSVFRGVRSRGPIISLSLGKSMECEFRLVGFLGAVFSHDVVVVHCAAQRKLIALLQSLRKLQCG